MTRDAATNLLSADFLSQATVYVARELLGHELWMCRPRELPRRFRIIETEAYTRDDPACHAFRGNCGRGAVLFESPGTAYVYFIYGMHHCLNVVTEPTGTAGAVLFRALEAMHPADVGSAIHGPGRLCRHLGITTRDHNRMNLLDPNGIFSLRQGSNRPGRTEVASGPRIGISKAKEYPWRFWIRGTKTSTNG